MINDATLAEVKPNEWFETVGVERRKDKIKVDPWASDVNKHLSDAR